MDSNPDLLDPQDFGFLDPNPKKYEDPRIRIERQNIKAAKKYFLLSRPKSELSKKERL